MVTLRMLADAPLFSSELESVAIKAWESRPAASFNGSLLVCSDFRKDEGRIDISGAFTEFRYYYAQNTSGIDFGLRIMAVSGLTLCEDQVIFARRAAHVTTYPGWLELVPSGSIDRSAALDDGTIDFIGKLREEFTEETTLPIDSIHSIEPFAVVYDPAVKIYDIACTIHSHVSKADILAGLHQSDEYTEPVAVPVDTLDTFREQHADDIIPASHAILTAWQR